MDVNSPEKARAWLAAWKGAPPRGILFEALRGLELAAALSRPGPGREALVAARAILEAKV